MFKKDMSPDEKRRAYCFLGIGFVVGVCSAAVIGLSLYTHRASQTVKVMRQSDISANIGYTFTDPLVTVSVSDTEDSSEYATVQKNISSYIQAQKTAGSLSSVSVNFRDIDNSDGFSINPNELYDPASLTKIPLMMAYYDLAEQDPSILSTQIVYPGTQDLDAAEQVESPIQLITGQSYSVNDLIDHMIQHSDNNAEDLLANHLSDIGQLGALSSVFNNLGISTSTIPDNTNVRSYSLFLRVLYNATYLDRDYSEQALKLLSETDFSQGISTGVPNTITVAQKFGDARIPDSEGNTVGVELQNCGIVYYPSHPYILCVMTKGSSIGDVEKVIDGISKIIFDEVEQRYPAKDGAQ